MTHYSAAQIRRLRAGVVLIVGTLSGSGISGCGSSNSSGPSAPGSLSVAIVGAGGVTPSVVVDGPGGYQQIMTATGTLSGLTPGSYGVTARSVAGSGSIVPVVYGATVTGSPVTVSSGATATASVSYAARPGTGVLWVGNAAENGPLLAGYTAAQLTASTSAPPAIVLTASPQSGTSPVTGVAFDKDGNLWVASSLDSTVSEYTAAQLATSGSVTPAVVLSSTPDADYPRFPRWQSQPEWRLMLAVISGWRITTSPPLSLSSHRANSGPREPPPPPSPCAAAGVLQQGASSGVTRETGLSMRVAISG